MPRTSRSSKSHKQTKQKDHPYHSDNNYNNNNDDGNNIRVSGKVNESVVEEVFEMPVKRRRDRCDGEDKCEVSKDVGEAKSRSSRGEKRAEKESGRKEGRDAKIRDEWPIEEESRNIELEKELKKRIKRREGYEDVKEGFERMMSAKSARSQDVKQREEKRGENGERVSKSRDYVKHRADTEKDSNKYRDDKHREDDRPTKDKHREDGERDRQRENKNREDIERDRHREDKHREVDRQREDVEQDRQQEDKHHEDSERDRQREDKHREDSNRDNRYKNERYREDVDRPKNWSPREDNPMYDDRGTRHKDIKDRKKDNNTDEYSDYRTRGIKNQYAESENRSMNDAKIDMISERGRPSSVNDDMEFTSNSSRRRNSPDGKFYPSRDHHSHRVSKQEETKYRDYVHKERKFDKVSSRSLEKIGQKEADYSTDDILPGRHPRSETRSSPVVDICQISPSSTNNERRHMTRPDVRRNLDVEVLGPRSGGSKDAKEYSDGPLGFPTSEDDRGKPNNHNRRSSGDPNMGRPQNNWNNFPNNGYIPFHHPPPLFTPVMQQYMPPMFGRPPMNLNHAGISFPGHRNPVAWRGQVVESIPPPLPLHGWEPNNSVFGTGPHGYVNWDHGRPQLNNQLWESSVDMQSADQKIDHSVHGPSNEVLSGETDPPIEKQPDFSIQEVVKVTESSQISAIVKEEDDTLMSQVYLSKIDISKDLTEPQLYDQCTSMLGLDQPSVSDGSDCKILFFEEDVEADMDSGASLFEAIDDSVFKKAMSLYTKHKVHFSATSQEGVLNGAESVSAPDQEKTSPVDDGKVLEEAPEDPVLEVKKENGESPTDPVNEDILDNNRKTSDETSDKMNMEVDHPVENQESGGCEVKVKLEDTGNYECSMELDKPSAGDSLLLMTDVSTPEFVESGSINISRIHHSPESTH